jgi:hypothetical protein
MVSMASSVQLVMIGILGEYVGRIYEQLKQRPLYVLRAEPAPSPLSRRPTSIQVSEQERATSVASDPP